MEWTGDKVRSTVRLAGQVLRYHTWPTLRTQTVGEHTWQIMRIYLELFHNPEREVWEYILHHDSGELVVGDLPFPLKAKNPKLKSIMDELEDAALNEMDIPPMVLYPADKWRVKICDLIEMMEFGLQEEAMGNTFAAPITRATAAAVRSMAEAVPEGVGASEVARVKQKVMTTLAYYKGERQHVA